MPKHTTKTCIDCRKTISNYYAIRCPKCYAKSRVVPLIKRFLSKIKKTKSCWYWTDAPGRNGYGSIFVRGRLDYAHRVSWIIHNGTIPKGKVVRHTCDVRQCVRPSHLLVGTKHENTQDAIGRGRLVVGERHKGHKLTEKIVKTIRSSYRQGHVTMRSLAEEYGVCQQAISKIVLMKIWKHVV